MLEEIKNKALDDNFIVEMKKKDWRTTEYEVYSIRNDILIYNDIVVVALSLQKRILKELHTEHPGLFGIKS